MTFHGLGMDFFWNCTLPPVVVVVVGWGMIKVATSALLWTGVGLIDFLCCGHQIVVLKNLMSIDPNCY